MCHDRSRSEQKAIESLKLTDISDDTRFFFFLSFFFFSETTATTMTGRKVDENGRGQFGNSGNRAGPAGYRVRINCHESYSNEKNIKKKISFMQRTSFNVAFKQVFVLILETQHFKLWLVLRCSASSLGVSYSHM